MGSVPVVNCDYCGDEFEQSEYKLDRNDNQFCSTDCYRDWRQEDWKPDGWKGGKVEKACEQCGDSFEVYPYRADSARFCSRECSDKSMAGKTGEQTPAWEDAKEQFTCENCGETFTEYPYRNDRKYCSKSCYREASQEIFSGENNPVWRGGRPDYYGPNWEQQRQAALERDHYCCQDCGKHADEMDRSPDVHHKKRLGWFREEYDAPDWWEKANRVANLVTLCPSCHKKREWSSAD